MKSPRKAERIRQLSLLSSQASHGGFDVRESGRARRLRIDVHPHGGVTVVVPRRTHPRVVREFVSEHWEWVEKTRAELGRRYPVPELSLPSRLVLPAIDQSWQLRYLQASSARCNETAGQLRVAGNLPDEAGVRKILRRWLSRCARRHLVPWLGQLAQDTGLTYRRTQIRCQRTLWGSCSSSGTISLNYCLLFLEPRVVRYLLLHELCHTRHMNHSKRFWALVARYEPSYKSLDQKLSASRAAVPAWVLVRP